MSDPDITQKITGDRNIVVGMGNVTVNNMLPPAGAKDRRRLGILLERVRQFWIEGVLEHSVHGAVLLILGKIPRPEAVDHPWARVLELPGQTTQTLPSDMPIGEIFDEAGRALLILGEPGSGKTTTLLELARDLIPLAERDPSQPVPVVFNLSTWMDRHGSLLEWLVAELTAKYFISKRSGRAWLKQNRLVLLLDGLDEMRADRRANCVEAINQFVQTEGISGLVVCSRFQEYTTLPVRLKLNGAIRLQPLSLEQVDTYLVAGGSQLSALHITLQEDQVLQTLAQSPLMLDVMTLAYQGLSPEALTSTQLRTAEERRQHIFATYVERMFERRGKADQPYAKEPTKRWLSWLAQQMRQHVAFEGEALDPQDVFLLEQLQPNLLSTSSQRWIYTLSSRMVGGLIAGLGVGAVVALSYVVVFGLSVERLVAGLTLALSAGLMAMFSGGLIAGLRDALQFTRRSKSTAAKKAPTSLRVAITVVITFCCYLFVSFVLVGLLVSLLVEPLAAEGSELSKLLMLGLLIGGVIGAICGVMLRLRRSRRSITSDIQTIETIRWSWSTALSGCVVGMLVGMMAVGISPLWLRLGNWRYWLYVDIGGGLTCVLIGMIFGGLTYDTVEAKTFPNQGIKLSIRNSAEAKTFPNQGIKLSIRNSALVGLIIGLIDGLISGLFAGQSVGLGLIVGLIISLLGGLWYGGWDVIQHYTLRFILYYKGYTPRYFVRFLDYAARLIFLQRVGGGYIFIHRLLLEHFAALNARYIELIKPVYSRTKVD